MCGCFWNHSSIIALVVSDPYLENRIQKRKVIKHASEMEKVGGRWGGDEGVMV